MMYRCDYFRLEELFPQKIYADLKGFDRLWWLIDSRVLWTMDRLRERYGKCFANDWAFGGSSEYRVFRPWDCAVGALMSQHKFGRACDLVFETVQAEEVREDIRRHPNEYSFHSITCIEIEVAWFHFDCRNWTQGILEVKP